MQKSMCVSEEMSVELCVNLMAATHFYTYWLLVTLEGETVNVKAVTAHTRDA